MAAQHKLDKDSQNLINDIKKDPDCSYILMMTNGEQVQIRTAAETKDALQMLASLSNALQKTMGLDDDSFIKLMQFSRILDKAMTSGEFEHDIDADGPEN